MKILVVDDSAFSQKIARIYLEMREGHSVVTANDGKQGIEKARLEAPDLIILDVEMAEMGGDEALRILKQDRSTMRIPVIMCTGLSREEVLSMADLNLAQGYIQKPYGYNEIKNIIAAITGAENYAETAAGEL